MSDGSAEGRIARHARISAVFERMTDAELRDFIGLPGEGRGWGDSRPMDVGGEPVFVKRLPVTKLEVSAPFSTKNLYELPLYYQYGVGSFGFGAFREIEAHRRATEWVLTGACRAFPLMHHVRLLECPPVASMFTGDRHREYIAYWGGSEALSRVVTDRNEARCQAVLILEHFPATLAPWLSEHPEAIDDSLGQLFRTIRFLRSRGVVHFDANFQNVVTDGESHFLTDFGLLLDSSFDLGAHERDFLARHMDYDFAQILWSAGIQLGWHFGRLDEETRQRVRQAMRLEGPVRGPMLSQLVQRAEEFASLAPVPAELMAVIRRYEKVIAFFAAFFAQMRENPRKDTPFDSVQLRGLLEDAGVEA